APCRSIPSRPCQARTWQPGARQCPKFPLLPRPGWSCWLPSPWTESPWPLRKTGRLCLAIPSLRTPKTSSFLRLKETLYPAADVNKAPKTPHNEKQHYCRRQQRPNQVANSLKSDFGNLFIVNALVLGPTGLKVVVGNMIVMLGFTGHAQQRHYFNTFPS